METLKTGSESFSDDFAGEVLKDNTTDTQPQSLIRRMWENIRNPVNFLFISTSSVLIVGGSVTNNLDLAHLGWFTVLTRVLIGLHKSG